MGVRNFLPFEVLCGYHGTSIQIARSVVHFALRHCFCACADQEIPRVLVAAAKSAASHFADLWILDLALIRDETSRYTAQQSLPADLLSTDFLALIESYASLPPDDKPTTGEKLSATKLIQRLELVKL